MQEESRRWRLGAGALLPLDSDSGKQGAERWPTRTPERVAPLRRALRQIATMSVAMGGKNGIVLAAGAAAATGYGIYLFFRWRKYRVLFSPVYTENGVPIKKKIYKVRYGKVESENRGAEPMDDRDWGNGVGKRRRTTNGGCGACKGTT